MRKSTKSKKLQWYENINSYPNLYGLGIEKDVMAALAKRIAKDIDDEIINHLTGVSPLKDGII